MVEAAWPQLKLITTQVLNSEGLPDRRLLMPEAGSVQVNLDGGPITSSVSDISKHPPIINKLSTDATARPGNIGLVKGAPSLCCSTSDSRSAARCAPEPSNVAHCKNCLALKM